MTNRKEERKVAVVSGGLGGVGRAVCVRLAADGFDIVAFYFHTPHEEASAFIETLTPGNHRAIQCDIRDATTVERVFTRIAQEYGNVYACIHAAVDPILRKDMMFLEDAELKNQLETAFVGGLHLFQNVSLLMKKSGDGRIIGILSRYIFATTAHKKMAGYLLAKHALRGLLREMYLELLPVNITVSAVAPEFLDTKLSADVPKEVRDFIKTRGVHGSMKTPEDVADAVSFLCSEQGISMNGKIFSPEELDIALL